MSNSTCDETISSSTDSGSPRNYYLGSSYSPRWIMGSLCVHGLLALILALTPAGRIIFRPSKGDAASVAVKADRIEEVVDHLRRREEQRLSEQIEEMYYVEEQMGHIYQHHLDQYEELSADLSLEAPDKALAMLEDALAAQQRALEAQKQTIDIQAEDIPAADKAFAEAKPEESKTLQDNVVETRRQALDRQVHATDSQSRVTDAQKEAMQNLSFSTEQFETAKRLQIEANQAQDAANKTQDQANQLQEQAWHANRYTLPDAIRNASNAQRSAERAQEDADKRKSELDKTTETLAETRPKLEDAKQQQLQATEQLAAAQTSADQTAETAKNSSLQSDKRAADQARKQVDSARNRLNQTDKSMQDRTRDVSTWEQRVSQAQERFDSAQSKVTPARNHATEITETATTAARNTKDLQTAANSAQKQAAQAQIKAIETQQKAVSGIAKAIKERNTASAKETTRSIADSTNSGLSPQTPPDLSGRNIAELYDDAIHAESQIAQKHKHIKAAATALKAMVPMSDALAQTEVAVTTRPQLDRALLTQPVRTSSTAAVHKAELSKARQEIGSMMRSAYQRLSESQGIDTAKGTDSSYSVSLADIKAAAQVAAAMKAAALEDLGARYKDLAALMAQADAMAAGSSAMDNSALGTGGSTHGEDSADNSGAPTGNSPVGSDTGSSQGKFGQAFADPPKSPDMRILGGTRLITNGPRGTDTNPWLCVDTWYTIGPFPNPSRRNIDTKFPPESVIDLDAVYTGKNGRPVRWDFVKSPSVAIIPANADEYTIFYAYTELWLDEACDLLIAVGSDDNSRLWINGHLVWMSGKELKIWQVDEGFRKVHFRKGINRVLYRVENGWHGVLFSMLISLTEQ